MCALFYPKQLDLWIFKELDSKWNKLVPMEEVALDKLMGLINCILTVNYITESLKALCD